MNGSGLSPELKSWIDRVVVPALVREYLSSIESKKLACSEREPVAEYPPESRVSSEGHG
jgi:hypothetical protein